MTPRTSDIQGDVGVTCKLAGGIVRFSPSLLEGTWPIPGGVCLVPRVLHCSVREWFGLPQQDVVVEGSHTHLCCWGAAAFQNNKRPQATTFSGHKMEALYDRERSLVTLAVQSVC